MVDSHRSPGIWFPDGNVILRAEESAFRVYSGILSQHSAVFKALFTLPQPIDHDEIMDGCTVVTLQDDEVDLERFLRVLHDWSYLDSVSKDVPALLSILRMSTKYDVSRLRKRVIKTLEAHYPQDPLRSPWSPVSLYPFIFPSSAQSALAIAAANSARQAEALTLLPAALFACCSVDPDCLVGPEHPDVHVGLSPENLFTVLKGRNDIILFTRRHIFGFAFTPRDVPDCRTPSECRRVRAEWAEYTDKHHPDGWTNPLSPGTFISTLSRVACMKCTDEAKRSFERGQRELWNDLPRIFGLPAWDKLEQMSTMDEENC